MLLVTNKDLFIIINKTTSIKKNARYVEPRKDKRKYDWISLCMIRNFVHILILLNFVQRIFGYSQSIIDMSIDIVETYGNMNIRI